MSNNSPNNKCFSLGASEGNAKSYVVTAGRKPGVYRTWEECAPQVLGFPGNVVKGYESYEAACAAIYGMKKGQAAEEGGKTCCHHCDDLQYKVQVLEEQIACLLRSNPQIHPKAKHRHK